MGAGARRVAWSQQAAACQLSNRGQLARRSIAPPTTTASQWRTLYAANDEGFGGLICPRRRESTRCQKRPRARCRTGVRFPEGGAAVSGWPMRPLGNGKHLPVRARYGGARGSITTAA
jgi:hypothetical protein